MDPTTVTQIFQRFKKHNPHPKTELHFQTPFELLVAVILSAQATDVSVNQATKVLFKVANTPQKIVDLGLQTLEHYLKKLNLYRNKAKYIFKTSQILLEKHHSRVPHEREALEALPGVGRKTANVILNTAFGDKTIAVDTHIFRVANRTGLAKSKTPLAVEQRLMKIIPARYLKDAHHWLVLHGRYICKARKPLCYACPIVNFCQYPDKNLKKS